MSQKPPVEPVDAATVMLVRNGEPIGSPWEVFMIRRPAQSEFAADVFVFPGGKVDAEDHDARLAAYVEEHLDFVTSPRGDAEGLALRAAAVRELFEEAGVLLAKREKEGMLRFTNGEAERFARYREQLQAGQITLVDLARAEELTYSLDRLHPFSRWITPPVFPRRYDTRFYVAYLPKHQSPLRCPHETTESVWISPGEALDRYHHGEFPLVFATERHLEQMTRYHSIDQMIASREAADLESVMPKIVERGGERHFLVPGDEGY